jgi:hypothetical protein
VRRLVQILGCSVALAALGLVVTATALASGSGTSAGDQQYVDPLTTSTAQPTTQSSTTPSASSAPTSPAPSATTAAAPTSTTTATTPSSPSSHAASGTLPFTGLNIEACVAVGAGLLGAGLVLRRAVARA